MLSPLLVRIALLVVNLLQEPIRVHAATIISTQFVVGRKVQNAMVVQLFVKLVT